jgi:ankyrin repeat protein
MCNGLPLLTMAIVSGQLSYVRLLLQRGADVHALNALTQQFTLQNTPLYWCTMKRKGAEMTALLLEYGAAVNSANSSGDSPLLGAAISGDLASARVLIRAGADVGAVCSNGMTSLHPAARWGHLELLQLLLEHGAAAVIDSLSPACGHSSCGKSTALMACDSPAAVKVLLAAGADVHVTTDRGNTALHVAAVHKYPAPVLCLLIKAGVDLHAVNSDGKTAAQVAVDSGNTLAAALLTRAARDT